MSRLISIFSILLLVMAWISINIYLPALPILLNDFHTTPLHLKFAATFFLIGYTVTQLIWGPLSEKYGRKNPIFWGLLLSVIGILVTIFSHDVYQFDLGRLIEGFGLGCAPGIGRAIITDSFDEIGMAKLLAIGSMTANAMPGLAPLFGAQLLHYFGWRSIFIFILIYTLLLIGLIVFMTETNKKIQRDLEFKNFFTHYLVVIKNRQFLAYSLPYLFLTGAMIAFYTITPFIFVNSLKLTAMHYTYAMLFLSAFYILGSVTVRLFAGKLKGESLLVFAGILLIVTQVIFFIFYITDNYTVFSVLIPMALYLYATGIVSPICNSKSLVSMKTMAGFGSAALGIMVYLSSTFNSLVINLLHFESLLPLMLFIFVVCLLAILSFLTFNRRTEKYQRS